MKTNYYLRKWLASSVMLLTIGSANAHDFEADGIFYNIISQEEKTVEVTFKGDNYNDSRYPFSDVTIPGNVINEGTEYSVIGIGDRAFHFNDLKNIILPEGIKYIGMRAFYATWLVTIDIPSSLTSIGERAFETSSLKSINIPSSVTSIGDGAFRNTNFTSFDWPEHITTIGEGMFGDSRYLTKVNIPEGVTTIGKNAFSGCEALTDIGTLPSTLTTIGDYAFSGCYFSSIVLPENLKTIGKSAFSVGKVTCQALVPPTAAKDAFGSNTSNLSSKTLTVPDEAARAYAWSEPWCYFNIPNYDGIKFGDKFSANGFRYSFLSEEDRTVSIAGVVGSEYQTLYGGATSITLPDKVVYKDIEWTVEAVSYFDPSYYGGNKLETIVLPNTIKVIGDGAFNNASDNLTSINFPEKLEVIGNDIFPYGSQMNFTSIVFPETLKRIGSLAFNCCHKLKSIVLPAGFEVIGTQAFPSSLTSVTCKALNVPALMEYNGEIIGYDYGYDPSGLKAPFAWSSVLKVMEESIPEYRGKWTRYFTKTLPIDTEVKIGSTGYASLFLPDASVRIPEGVTAYTGVINGSWLSLSEVEGKIPAGSAVILKGAEGEYSFVHVSQAEETGENDLKGTAEDFTADGSQYVLANKEGAVGFYHVNAGTTIPAGKAYLEVTESDVKEFFLFADEATGIEGVQDVQKIQDARMYDLSGRRVEKATKGVYIINGQKILK